MTNLVKLNFLDVRFNPNITNSILDSALLLECKRNIEIICSDTSVDAAKFVYENPTCTQKSLDRDLYLYAFQNLKFEAFKSKKINGPKENVWEDDFDYIESDDEDDALETELFMRYSTVENGPKVGGEGEEDNKYKHFDYYVDDDDEDDFDDFINNDENEMLNELDEY